MVVSAQQPLHNPNSQPSSSSSSQKPPQPPVPDHCMHKNRLQEYVQRSALSLPSYHTVNLGSQHEPKFKSTVWVDSIAYSSQTFLHKKDAEQNAAKVALETILKKIKDQGCPQIHEDLTYCKSILNEFATKRSLELPTYNTTMAEGAIIQLFVSTVVFHGKTYTGRPGRNKKEAEQLGAQSVIKSILGTEAGPFLCQIVNTKRKFYAALGKASDDNVFSVPSSENLALKKPKLENVGGTSTGSVVDITPLVAQPQSDVNAEGINNPKKKNKRKGHRAILVNGGVKPGALPLIQESACSVAQ